MFKVITYYTINTPYENEIADFKEAIDKVGLEYEIIPVTDKGDWVQNLRLKPHLILEALNNNPEHDILYTDIDSRIMREPVLFNNFTGDVGFHIFKGKPAAGTIFVKNTDNGKQFMEEWIKEQDLNPSQWDQGMLNNAYNNLKDELNIIDLPPEYAKIFDLMAQVENPVIEHFQASRKYKNEINNPIQVNDDGCYLIPKILFNMRVRVHPNGTFTLPRVNNSQIKELNKKFIKLPNENRWYAQTTEDTMTYKDFYNIFKDKGCYFIGKGPSLDKINESYFKEVDWPVMCVNESIHKIETLDLLNPIFIVQQDANLKDTCKPKKGIIFISFLSREYYKDIKNKCIYYPEHFHGGRGSLTIIMAMRIAHKLGSNEFKFLCFDSCINQATEYAECIGYKSNLAADPSRFLKHKGVIEAEFKQIPKEFIPVDLDQQDDDTLLLSLDNLEEHHDD